MFSSCLPLLFRLYVSPKKQVADPGPESPLKWCRQVLDHRSPETEMACRTLISRLDQSMLLINTFLHLTEPKYLLMCVLNHSLQRPLEEKSFSPSQTQRQFYRLRCLCCFLIYSSLPLCMCMHLCGFQSYDDAWLLTVNVYMVCVCVSLGVDRSLCVIQRTLFIIYLARSSNVLCTAEPQQQSYSHQGWMTTWSHGLGWITFPPGSGVLFLNGSIGPWNCQVQSRFSLTSQHVRVVSCQKSEFQLHVINKSPPHSECWFFNWYFIIGAEQMQYNNLKVTVTL